MFIVVLYWLVATLRVVAAAFSKRWRVSGFRAVSLVVSIPLALAGLETGDYLHLLLFYPHHWNVIKRTAERPVRFGWGDEAVTVMDGLKLRTLIYDDSGKAEKQLNLERRGEGLSSMTVHLFGKFFIERTWVTDR